MTFEAPALLLALVLVPIVVVAYILFERSRERRAATWANPAMFPNLVHRPSLGLRHIPAALFILALTLLLVGFARPTAKITSVRQGATVVLVIDTSGSMAATDVPPTRLAAAHKAILEFLKVLPKQYRVGVVTFTDSPSVKVLPTYDRKLIAEVLPKKTKKAGTQLGGALQKAIQVAVRAVGQDKPGSPHPPAAVLLLSDGKQTQPGTTVEKATQLAKRSNVPISTIALGTANGTVKLGQVIAGGFDDRKAYPVPVDGTTLQSIAVATGGKYAQTPTLAALTQVFTDLGNHQVKEHKQHEITSGAVGLAILLIVPAILLSGIWFRRVA